MAVKSELCEASFPTRSLYTPSTDVEPIFLRKVTRDAFEISKSDRLDFLHTITKSCIMILQIIIAKIFHIAKITDYHSLISSTDWKNPHNSWRFHWSNPTGGVHRQTHSPDPREAPRSVPHGPVSWWSKLQQSPPETSQGRNSTSANDPETVRDLVTDISLQNGVLFKYVSLLAIEDYGQQPVSSPLSRLGISIQRALPRPRTPPLIFAKLQKRVARVA